MMARIWWISPTALDPPHAVGRPEHVDALADALRDGWGAGYPALVGYVTADGERIQLLSGTHRRAAAERLGEFVPVVVHQWRDVEDAWGDLDRWALLMDAPVVR